MDPDRQISIDNIQTVALYFNIKIADMVSKRRNRTVARPRQMAMALAKELTNHSLPEIETLLVVEITRQSFMPAEKSMN